MLRRYPAPPPPVGAGTRRAECATPIAGADRRRRCAARAGHALHDRSRQYRARGARHAGGEGPALDTISWLVGIEVEHPDWLGLTAYDLLFPLFIFIVGVVIPISLRRQVEREGLLVAHWRMLRRTALLFFLGFLYYGGLSHQWPDVRLMGVLQRIALCYLFASLLFLHLRLRGLMVAFVVLMVGYWALLTFIPVPGPAPIHMARRPISRAGWTSTSCRARSCWDARSGRPAQHIAGDRHGAARHLCGASVGEPATDAANSGRPADLRRVGAARGRRLMAFAISDEQVALDVILCPRHRRARRASARGILPSHRHRGISALVRAFGLDRRQRDPPLSAQ